MDISWELNFRSTFWWNSPRKSIFYTGKAHNHTCPACSHRDKLKVNFCQKTEENTFFLETIIEWRAYKWCLLAFANFAPCSGILLKALPRWDSIFRRQLSTFIKQDFSPFAIFTVSIALFQCRARFLGQLKINVLTLAPFTPRLIAQEGTVGTFRTTN